METNFCHKALLIILYLCLISGCADFSSNLFPKDVMLPERGLLDYDKEGYEEVKVGPYVFLLPERVEKQHQLISKIRDKSEGDAFKKELRIDVDGVAIPLFTLNGPPVTKIYRFKNGESAEYPKPKDCFQKLFIDKGADWFWQLCPAYDYSVKEYYLYKDYRYLVKISFAKYLEISDEEIQTILSSFTRTVSDIEY